MEHLLVASGGNLAELSVVPYVATDDYQHKTLEEYLDTEWWQDVAPRWPSLREEEGVSILQTWAFFGLFQQVLGPFFTPSEYVIEHRDHDVDSRKVLSTAKLPASLKAWYYHAQQNVDLEERLPLYLKLLSNLQRRGRRSADYMLHTLAKSDKAAHRAISISMLSAAMLLFDTLRGLCGSRASSLRWSVVLGPTAHDIEAMRKNGWCPSVAARVWDNVDIEAQMFLRTMPNLATASEDHGRCDAHGCNYAQIVAADFRPKHVEPGCRCSMWSVDESLLSRMIDDGQLPLIQFTLPGNGAALGASEHVDISLIASDGAVPYVALSHVWAHGLGNPAENSLPRCQLEQLASKVGSFRVQDAADCSNLFPPLGISKPFGIDEQALSVPGLAKEQQHSDARKLHVWLDSLCCPAKPSPQKFETISKMRSIYAGASDVLVLDKLLESSNVEGRSPCEISMYICLSSWAQRVWTLQEGVLAPILWFRFQNSYLRPDRLMLRMQCEIAEKPIVGLQTASDLFVRLALYNGGICKDLADRGVKLQWGFVQIVQAFLFRSLSVKSDEPFCLLNIVDDEAPATTASDKPTGGSKQRPGLNDSDAAMARFWDVCRRKRLLCDDIVFNSLPKMKLDGYRWAPASLLHDNHQRSRDTTMVGAAAEGTSSPPSQGDFDPRGFVISCQGFIISAPSSLSLKEQFLHFDNSSQSEMLLLDKTASRWHVIKIYKEMRLAFAALADDYGTGSTQAALVLNSMEKSDSLTGLFATVLQRGTLRDMPAAAFHHVRVHGSCSVASATPAHQQMLDLLMSRSTPESTTMTENLFQLARDAMISLSFSPQMLDDMDGYMVTEYIKDISQRLTDGQYLVATESFDEESHKWIVD